MNNTQLKKFSLEQTVDTIEVSKIADEVVYRVIGFENTLISTYDFYKNKRLPENIWSVSRAHDQGIYQLHINQGMLEEFPDSAIWAAKMLELQIYLKNHDD